MQKLGEIIKQGRLAKNIQIQTAAKNLYLKEEVLEALEEGAWTKLPEKAYIQGFIKNYADFLDLDSSRLLALFRAEYDERKMPKKATPISAKRRLMFTPNLIVPITFALAILVFIFYFAVQYTSVLSAPKLDIATPEDDITTTASVIEIAGNTDREATVSIGGQLAPVDESGKFAYQYQLEEGRNTIEIVASKKLSPKTKATRTVRLSK